VHVAQGEQRVVEVVALDQRHAKGIAPHHRAFRHALDAQHALVGRHAVGVAAVEHGLATGEAEQGTETQAKGHTGQRTEQAKAHAKSLLQRRR